MKNRKVVMKYLAYTFLFCGLLSLFMKLILPNYEVRIGNSIFRLDNFFALLTFLSIFPLWIMHMEFVVGCKKSLGQGKFDCKMLQGISAIPWGVIYVLCMIIIYILSENFTPEEVIRVMTPYNQLLILLCFIINYYLCCALDKKLNNEAREG